MSRRGRVALLAAVTASWLTSARADEYHYQGVPLGARAAGMGGAFTGLASDSSALYYNPGGMTFQSGTEFSLSTSVYSLATDSVDGGTAHPTFSAFPSTFALVKTPFWAKGQSSPRHRYGVGLFVTDHASVSRKSFDAAGDALQINTRDQTAYYGAAYGYRVTDRLGVGVALYLVGRDLVRFQSGLRRVGEDFDLRRQELTGSYYGGQAIAGALFRINERLSLGLAVRSPAVAFTSSLALNEFAKEPGIVLEEKTSRQGIFTHRVPPSATLGAAIRLHPRLLVTADVTGHAGTGAYPVFQTETVRELVDKHPVLNGAVGAEVQVARRVLIRGGASTDRSSRAAGAAPTDVTDASPDFFSITGAIGYEAERAAIVFGGAYVIGRVATDEYALRRRELRFWVAGSYRL